MPKRRTKKQKLKAKHEFLYHLDLGSLKGRSEPVVNRQINPDAKTNPIQIKPNDYSVSTAQYLFSSFIRRDLIKSLVYSFIILALEVMIYFKWQN